jgi:hypothetical protein
MRTVVALFTWRPADARTDPRLLWGLALLLSAMAGGCGAQDDQRAQALSTTDPGNPTGSLPVTAEDGPQEAQPLGPPEAGIGWPDGPPPKEIIEAWRGNSQNSANGSVEGGE